MDFNTLTLDMDMITPFMMFTADYEMGGKILLFPLEGKGDCVLNFSKSHLYTDCDNCFV
jgi:hypothetical protein